MIFELLKYFIVFLSVFAALSVLRLIVNFIRALLSNPPTKLTLDRGSLIYYGICISFLTTLIINNLI
jgi:hypothetical protein